MKALRTADAILLLAIGGYLAGRWLAERGALRADVSRGVREFEVYLADKAKRR